MATKSFTVIYVGAGEINFGSLEGPWAHSLRLERKFGASLKVLGIIDPDTERAASQIKRKVGQKVPGYDLAAAWRTPEEASSAALSLLGPEDSVDLIVVGAPPHFRGGTVAGVTDLDIRLLRGFPRCKRWLVEKPISAANPNDASAGIQEVYRAYADSGAVVGVGYMFCALRAVLKIQDIIRQKKLVVTGTQARYYMAYEFAKKIAWWNKSVSCGPVVEQATHFASLSLLFGGKVVPGSVRTHTVEHDDPPGKLSKLAVDEASIPEESRIPRYTNSIWKYQSGAVGSLIHVVALHGTTYDTEFEVLADGYVFKLRGVYTNKPTLSIRSPDHPSEEIHEFEDDDPFQTQMDMLISGKPACTYEEALDTYQLTWAIRAAGERERERSKAR